MLMKAFKNVPHRSSCQFSLKFLGKNVYKIETKMDRECFFNFKTPRKSEIFYFLLDIKRISEYFSIFSIWKTKFFERFFKTKQRLGYFQVIPTNFSFL